MSRKMWIASFIAFIILGAILSYEIMLWYLSPDIESNQNSEVVEEYEDENPSFSLNEKATILADTKLLTRITPSTQIVYQYYYTVDDKTVTDECEPPYYLIDMTRQELESYYKDWQLLSFSNEKVVLRKSIEGRHTGGYYVIREYEGLIAVFYDYTADFELAFEDALANNECKEEDRYTYLLEFLRLNEEHYLRELLDTPATLMSDEEMKRLEEGIIVYGDEELLRLLENYTS